MNAERIVRIVAGGFVLLSLALGVDASPLFVSKYEPVPERLHTDMSPE
jgi:hypothetical protein